MRLTRWLGAVSFVSLIGVLTLLSLSVESAPQKAGLKVSLVADASPGLEAKQGLNKTKLALQQKGITTDEATTPEAAKGDLLIVAGIARGSGPAAQMLQSLGVAAPEGNGKIYPDLEKETPYVVVKLQR